MSRPNILFVLGDDWGRYTSAYAVDEGKMSVNHLIDTPNVDRIAREGVRFRNAFVPAPSCTPCRSSILSGRYFWQTGLGAILQGAEWDTSIPTFALELERHGYHVGYTYKVWSPGRNPDAPFGGVRNRYQSAGDRFCWNFSRNATKLAANMSVERAKGVLYREVRDNFDEFLAARLGNTPFCYWWGPTNTHRDWQRGSGKNLWGLEPDDLKGRLPAFLPDVPAVREDFCDYLGECQAFDAGLGVILSRLEAIGELDNTLIVVSGDHGVPGMPRAKCNLYDIGCEVALVARWLGRIRPGRVVDDFVNLMDIAPTLCEAAGVPIPDNMIARSLMPVLVSDRSGQIEPDRDYVVTGRERHVARARPGKLPYPQRALRTSDFLYVRNFEPDRWPIGDPGILDDPTQAEPDYQTLCNKTELTYADMDGSPTKAWMIHHRNDAPVRPLYQLAFGKRPGEELYDLRTDPHYMNNLAGDPAYREVLDRLGTKLMAVLTQHNDPRVTQAKCCFESSPYTD
ncbi:MAG: sulfatase-like hydrolase/transferase [Phycisphaera sp.]|nr:sulfatase-like hydrolase/transferase [Phycisphaera sp.]